MLNFGGVFVFQVWGIHSQHVNFVHCWWMMSLSETRFIEIYIYLYIVYTVYGRSIVNIVNMYYISGFVSSKQAVIDAVLLGFFWGWRAQQTNRWIMLKPFRSKNSLELKCWNSNSWEIKVPTPQSYPIVTCFVGIPKKTALARWFKVTLFRPTRGGPTIVINGAISLL